MKTYSFIVSISNSTIVEVNAENFEDAKKSALDRFYECGVISDLCNPSDMGVDIELEDEYELKSAHTFMMGKREDASELCKELNAILGRNEFVVSSDGAGVLGISAEELTDEEIERLNLSEDFIIK